MSILDTVKSVAGLAKKIGDIELQSQIIDLQSEVYTLMEENHQLRMKMNEVDDIKQIEEKLRPVGQAYYVEKNEKLEGPYCTGCWDKDNKLIRLHIVEPYADFYTGTCPVCKTMTYYTSKEINNIPV